MLSQLKNTFLDNPLLHVMRNFACLVPGVNILQQARTVTGAMNDSSVMASWASLVAKDVTAAGLTINGSRLLEVGPGHSLGVAFGLLAAGANEICVLDVRKYADLSDLLKYESIVTECKRIGLAVNRPDISAASCAPRLHYSLVGDDGRWPVPDASIDVVYSYFAGEHLRQPATVLRETFRVLRPGGVCIYAIDLRDHFHFEGNWLQFLYYAPWLWEAMSSRRGKWTNRLRAPDWRALFENNFDVIRFSEERTQIHPSFDPERLATEFKKYNLETLSISGLWIVAIRSDRSTLAPEPKRR